MIVVSVIEIAVAHLFLGRGLPQQPSDRLHGGRDVAEWRAVVSPPSWWCLGELGPGGHGRDVGCPAMLPPPTKPRPNCSASPAAARRLRAWQQAGERGASPGSCTRLRVAPGPELGAWQLEFPQAFYCFPR